MKKDHSEIHYSISNSLYKFFYFDQNGYWKIPFESGQVHFDSFSNFNDPYEGYFKLTKSGTFEQKYKKLCSWNPGNDFFNNMKAGDVENYLKNLNLDAGASNLMRGLEDYGICCFSKSNENILMWAHYARSHKGFCLEIDRSKLETQGSGDGLFFLDVKYIDRVPEQSIFSDEPLEDLLKYKSTYWEYEKEVRAIKNSAGLLKIGTDAIRSIIVGERIFGTPEAKDLAEIINLRCPHLASHLKVAKRRRDAYALSHQPLSLINLK
ncbi:MAG: DUF2971 domain-containing protein [Bdellovibrio sp.]